MLRTVMTGLVILAAGGFVLATNDGPHYNYPPAKVPSDGYSTDPTTAKARMARMTWVTAQISKIESQLATHPPAAQEQYLRQRLNDLQAELSQLQADHARAAEAASNPPAAATPANGSGQAPTVVYRGSTRTPAWFDEQYAKFKDQIAIMDGKYVNIGKALLDPVLVSATEPDDVGDVRRTPVWSKVFRVIGEKEVLMRLPPANRAAADKGKADENPPPASLFHVSGANTKGLAPDGALAQSVLLYAGSYPYTAKDGTTTKIQSYTAYTPLAREQFAAALVSGFQLVEYSRTPAGKEAKAGGATPSPIVATPVP
jgi:hypothetical protein